MQAMLSRGAFQLQALSGSNLNITLTAINSSQLQISQNLVAASDVMLSCRSIIYAVDSIPA